MSKAFFVVVLLTTFFSCKPVREENNQNFKEEVSVLYDSTLRPFYHGVASGDPLTDAVVIWTRVTPDDSLVAVDVLWEFSESEKFDSVLKSGNAKTSADKDFTVKVDVGDLSAGKFYYYRFKALGKTSAVGRTKTLEIDPTQIKLAVVSCSNWEFGYFNAYRGIAAKDLDAVVHLGDYIYETPRGGYANKDAVDRKHFPVTKLITLKDYRTRYSQYHLDEGLRIARQKHPFITVWDDHEVANDVYATGAGAHRPEDGDFQTRKSAAKQAYYEWMPIREHPKLYRTFNFGKLASLIMLDERLEGREKQLENNSDAALFTQRTMLGSTQLNWFEEQLSNKSTSWKIIGNQVLFSDLDRVPKEKGHQRNLDSWDGYPVEKKAIEDYIIKNHLDNIVFLAGDTHASWAFDVIPDPFAARPQKPVAVEFGATSISSGNANESAPDDTVRRQEQNILGVNPHLKYLNQRDHGYVLLTVNDSETRADFFFVMTLLKPDDRERLEKSFRVKTHAAQLESVSN